MNEKEHLRRMVQEDTGEAKILLPTVKRLQQWQAPTVTPETTQNLITLLSTELPEPVIQQRSRIDLFWNSWAILVLRSQFRVVQRELWLASALVITLGTIVTLATYNIETTNSVLPLVILAPLVTAIGIAFVYGPLNDPALEIELAAPLSPRLIALARITLVFCFNLVLGIIGSAALSLSGAGLTFAPLVAAWLAPMAFLSAMAFLLSVVFFDPLTSAMFSGLIWLAMSMRHVVTLDLHPLLNLLPNLLTADARPLIWLLTVGLMGAALWLVGEDERWINMQG
jgi:hypothetical protein